MATVFKSGQSDPKRL